MAKARVLKKVIQKPEVLGLRASTSIGTEVFLGILPEGYETAGNFLVQFKNEKGKLLSFSLSPQAMSALVSLYSELERF